MASSLLTANRFTQVDRRWAGLFLLVSALVGLSLLVVPVHFVMAGIILLAVLAYLMLNPDKLFYLVIFTIPFTDRVRLLPISFSLNDLIIMFCAGVCVLHMVLRSQKINFRTALDPWMILLTILFALSGFTSIGDTGVYGFIKVFQAVVVYYMTVYFIQTKQLTRAQILRAILFTALTQACLGIFQSFTGIGTPHQSNRGYLGYLGLGSSKVWQGRGTMWHFNTLGNYLCCTFALFIPIYAFVIKQKKKALWMAGILLAGIITTYSRGSLLGLMAASIYFLAVSQPNLKRSLLFVAGFVLCVIYPAVSTLSNTSYVETVSYDERLIVWQVPLAAITSSAKSFWLGSGLNSYSAAAWPYIPAWVPREQYHYWFAHNFYLLTVVEVGIIGALLMFGFLSGLCLDTLRRFKKMHGYMRVYGLSISALIIALFFVSIFDHTFASPHFKIYIFLIFGLLYAKHPTRRHAY